MEAKSFIKHVAGYIMMVTLVFSGAVQANYPEKSVNYVIPFGPGGESDVTARHQQSFFKKIFNEDMVISYKPGGGGQLGGPS